MADIKRVEARLEHIRAVEPILGALRTISLGSWQSALNRGRRLQHYREQLQDVLAILLAHLPSASRRQGRDGGCLGRQVVLAIGSERGLCGRLNRVVLEKVEEYLPECEEPILELELAALGSRVVRMLRRRGHDLTWTGRLSMTSLPTYEFALDLSSRWLQRYERGEVDAVRLIYNTYTGVERYETIVSRFIPPARPPAEAAERWPPVIVDTDPEALFARVMEQWAAVDLYARLLDAAAAEHSARYQLLEGAVENADRLIEELTQQVNVARQEEITTEMQELAVGAGLLGSQWE